MREVTPGEIEDQPSLPPRPADHDVAADAELAPRRLRVGLLLDQLTVQAWQRMVIEDLLATEGIEVPVAVICWAPAERQPGWLENLLAGRLHRTTELYDRYEAISRRRCAGASRHAAARPLGGLLGKVDLLHVVPQRTKRVFDRFAEADLAAMRRYDLDVLLRFGFRILKGEVLNVPRHGVWSYHHGEPTRYRGGPACFWEMAQGERTVGVVLQRITEALDSGEILYRSTSSCPPTFWIDRAREAHFLKSARFVRRALEHLQRTGAPPRAEEPDPAQPEPRTLYRKPGNLRAAALLGRLAARSAVAATLNLIRAEPWTIALRRAASPLAKAAAPAPPIGRIGGRGWEAADPCLFAWQDQLLCFFERVAPHGKRGEIAVVRVLEDGRITEPQTVLAAEHHVSYPQLFAWQGRPAMLVECADSGEVALLQADGFPLLWRRRAVLLKGMRSYDPTLIAWRGLWYLFVTIDESGGGPNDELFLFVAETPLGPWRPHPLNPVVSDCRYARSAGALFEEGGVLIRPTQDCSGGYGRAINLCAVDQLTPTTFRQRPIGRIDPAEVGGTTGCHTLSRCNGIEAIDLRRYTLHWPRRRPGHARP